MKHMTRLGEYFKKKSASKASVARKTGLSPNRISAVTTKRTAKLTADELYLIALAIEVDPAELLEYVCSHLTLAKTE